MNIDLSEAELEKLLILAHLGEWMANATRNDPIKEFTAAASNIFAFGEGSDPMEKTRQSDGTEQNTLSSRLK